MPETSWDIPRSKKYLPLKRDIAVETAVIGGGLAGVLTAYNLAKKGRSVALLEKGALGRSVTLLTTAFLMEDIDTNLTDLKSMFGPEGAKRIWVSHQNAIDRIEAIINKEKINCEFVRVPAYIYANDWEEFEDLMRDHETAKELGISAQLHNRNRLPFPNYGIMELPRQAKFHPYKFVTGAAKAAAKAGAKIFEKTEIKNIAYDKSGATLKTSGGTVKAKQVVITTYYPFKNPKSTLLKKGMYVSYILEAKVPKGRFEEALYLDMANPYHYFRIDPLNKNRDRIILGGEDHRKEIKMSQAKNFRALESYLKHLLSADKRPEISNRWRGPILEPTDGLALIGRTGPRELVATAFSGNGMTYSMIAADLLADIISGEDNAFADLYDPKRIPTVKQVAKKFVDYSEEFIKGAGRKLIRKN